MPSDTGFTVTNKWERLCQQLRLRHEILRYNNIARLKFTVRPDIERFLNSLAIFVFLSREYLLRAQKIRKERKKKKKREREKEREERKSSSTLESTPHRVYRREKDSLCGSPARSNIQVLPVWRILSITVSRWRSFRMPDDRATDLNTRQMSIFDANSLLLALPTGIPWRVSRREHFRNVERHAWRQKRRAYTYTRRALPRNTLSHACCLSAQRPPRILVNSIPRVDSHRVASRTTWRKERRNKGIKKGRKEGRNGTCTVRYGTARHGTARHSTTRHGTHDTVPRGRVKTTSTLEERKRPGIGTERNIVRDCSCLPPSLAAVLPWNVPLPPRAPLRSHTGPEHRSEGPSGPRLLRRNPRSVPPYEARRSISFWDRECRAHPLSSGLDRPTDSLGRVDLFASLNVFKVLNSFKRFLKYLLVLLSKKFGPLFVFVSY